MKEENLNEILQNLRTMHRQAALDMSDCDPDPIVQFDKWMEEAISSQCDEPNAMILSTVHEGRPRARVVLLKGVQHGKLVFYTNYQSSKGEEIKDNSLVSLTFLWLPLQRQIRVEGRAIKVDAKTSDDYFHKRPRGNQLGAIASPQSKKIPDRATLEKLFKEAEEKYRQVEVLPRPQNWGGFEIDPDYFEFWQGRDNRMHDRIVYEKTNGAWVRSRLAP